MMSMHDDFDAILDLRVPEHMSAPPKFAEDIVLAALFTTTTSPPPLPREHAKSYRSSRTSES